MDLDPLRAALPMLTLCEREGVIFKRSAGNFVAPCPFHAEKSSSFTVHAKDLLSAHCYGCGWNGDIFKFWAEKRGLSLAGKGFAEVVEQLASLCGMAPPRVDVAFSAEAVKRKIPLSILEKRRPDLPELVPLTEEQARQLAERRGYDLAGLWEAGPGRGFLWFCYWPLDRDGRPDSRSRASWCITDRARRVAQFRRLDGGMYEARQNAEEIKAWTTRGAPWLVGCEETGDAVMVLLVEGGADKLAAWTLLRRFAATGQQEVAVCCIFGGSVHIAPECRAMLRGRHVRIVMDVDKERLLKRKARGDIMIRPGTEAACHWQEEMVEAGAVVDVFSLEGLVCWKDGEERPVGDLNDLLLMRDTALMEQVARELLALPEAEMEGREAA